MSELAPLLIALFCAALVRHLVTRVFYRWICPKVANQTVLGKRVDAEFEAMDLGELSEADKADERLKLFRKRGVTIWPGIVFAGGMWAIWLLCVGGSWIWALNTPALAASAGWVAWLHLAYSVVVGLVRAGLDPETREKSANLGVAGLGCSVVGLGVIFLPMTIMYSVAPIGVLLFSVLSWWTNWVLWRLVPYRDGAELPKIAMLFG